MFAAPEGNSRLQFLLALLAVVLPLHGFSKSVTLAWEPCPRTNIVSYVVYAGFASCNYLDAIPTGTETSLTLTNLAEHRTYYFAVTAINDLGLESMPSPEASYVVPGPPAGAYAGLLVPTGEFNGPAAGAVSLFVSAGGTYTGKLQLGRKRYPFSGKLDDEGAASVQVRAGPNLSFGLRLEFDFGNPAQRVSGTIDPGDILVQAHRLPDVVKGRNNRWAGRYTLALRPATNDAAAPAGAGWGTVTVSASGAASFAGVLADGTRLNLGGAVDARGAWAWYASLESGRKTLQGWIQFQDQSPTNVCGSVNWLQLPGKTASARSFNTVLASVGSVYVPAAAHSMPLAWSQGWLTIRGAGLPSPLVLPAAFTPAGVLTGTDFKVKLTSSTGKFAGTCNSAGASIPFSGVLLQSFAIGEGYAAAGSSNGWVSLSANPY